ncbi:MAG TPA: AI-2E family transporter [Saprospiraceae bacterium]|nr:AI-2E family transporter [Saprospiraceae bacterium]
MEDKVHFPFYIRISQVIIGIVGFFFILYIGQDIIIPLVFGTLIAILLNPLVYFLTNRKVNRVLAIFIVMFLSIIIAAALIYFFAVQASSFSDTFPLLEKKFDIMLKESSDWLAQTFHLSKSSINSWITKAKNEGLNNTPLYIGQTLSTMTGFIVILVLLPVYIFMILFYKPLLLDFIAMLFPKNQLHTVVEVLSETKKLIQNYLNGLFIEAIIVAILNSAALMILGVQYAILIGVIGALLNVIPYIGGVIAIAIPILVSLATQPPITAVYVVIAYLLVQFIDNNYIVPYIVASRVKLNALISVVVVLIGGALWGVPGMFLFLPITAILKIIFDRIDELKPIGFLFGDTMPAMGKEIFNFGRKKTPKKES